MKPTLYTLSNGLKIVLEENHTAPVISFNALVCVGSADETEDEAGISHLIEHMLFKGTPTRPVGTIARDVEGAGGDINAYTSFDQTVYYINMATRFADRGLEILTDAIQNPTFDAAELEREKEVVLEEIRRERDNPSRFVGEMLFQKAYLKHSYGRPIIGFEKTVKSFSREKLFEYFHRWYTPKNMSFIVVGDFESEKLLKKIERSFGPWTMDHGPWTGNKTRIEEPPQLKTRMTISPDNIQSIHFNLGFHIPEITHADVPILDLLSHLLGGAKSSKLEQILKEKKRLVQNIYSYAYTPKDPGLMMLGGQLNISQAVPAFQTLWEIIERFQAEGPTNEELKRAKHNIRANEIYEKETVGGLAGKLAYFLATAQSLDFEEQYYQRLQNVTAEEVAQAAERYLKRENMTAALLIPEKEDNKNVRAKIEAALEKSSTHAKKIETKPHIIKTEPHLVKLPNGVKLILKEDHDLPIVAVCATSLGGILAENKINNGINSLIAQCWTKGTKRRTPLQIAHAVEEMAGQMDGFSGKNSLGLKAEFLSEYLHEGLNLFCEVLLEPKWDPKEVVKEKKLALEALKNQEDNLSSLAFIHFQKNLYPTHPYGMRMLGSKESLGNLTPNKLKSYYQKLITSKNLVMGVVGDFDSDEIVKYLQEKLKRLPNTKAIQTKHKEDPKPKSIQKIVTKKEKEQAHVVLGFMGTTMDSPDHPVLTVLNAILSGQGGRLFLELRDKLSLAYSVTSVLHEGMDPGYFAIYIGTEPSKVPTALKGIEVELKKIITDLVTKEEFERTKNYLVGTYELELQKNLSLAQGYAFNELYGMGYEEVKCYPEKIMKVTREDVLRVAKKYIDLDAYVLSIVAP
ncbi:MAG: insulinase family protein [Deltaproteobacteria bacterium]|nr:insulinase family protein [Deltaproteobacteria bacterium]